MVGGGKLDYRIEAGEPAADVLTPNHSFAKELMGAKVGEERTAPPGVGQPQSWEVRAIKHKYVDLLHRALGQHSTRFPGSHALGSFQIEPEKENGFEPVFEQVRARAKYAEDVTKLYDEKDIPVDYVGRMLGVDAIDASLGLRYGIAKRLDNCVGAHKERAAAISNMAAAESVIVDPLTLAIWNEMDFCL